MAEGIQAGFDEASQGMLINLEDAGEEFIFAVWRGVDKEEPGLVQRIADIPQSIYTSHLFPNMRDAGDMAGAALIDGIAGGFKNNWVYIKDTWYQVLRDGVLKPLDEVLREADFIVNRWASGFFSGQDGPPGTIPGEPPEPPPDEPPPPPGPGGIFPDLPMPPWWYPGDPYTPNPPPAYPGPLSGETIYNIYPTYGAYTDEATLNQDIKLLEMLRGG